MNIKNNCFNTIRLVLAVRVFLGHVIPSLQVHLPYIFNPLLNILFCLEGVPGFFVLSGFLLWNSIGKVKSFKQYVLKRSIRIYPELWGGVLVTALLLLILYLPNIVWKDFLAFNVAQLTIFQFFTPESLKGYSTGHPNGPLWSISVTLQCYIALYFLYKMLHNRRIYMWFFAISAFILFNFIRVYVLQYMLPGTVYRILWYTFVSQIWLFLIGAFIREFFDSIKNVIVKYWYIFGLALYIVVHQQIDIKAGYHVFKCIFMAVTIIGFAYRFPMLNLKKDISYGIYIYHMIIINVMVYFSFLGKNWYVFIALVYTITIAYLSNKYANKCTNYINARFLAN